MKNKNEERQRPKWLWPILIWYVGSAGYALVALVYIFIWGNPVSSGQTAYLERLTPMDHVATIVISTLNITGAIALFYLQKVAVPILVSGLATHLLTTVFQVLTRDLFDAMSTPDILSLVVGYSVMFGVCVYAYRLRLRGVIA